MSERGSRSLDLDCSSLHAASKWSDGKLETMSIKEGGCRYCMSFLVLNFFSCTNRVVFVTDLLYNDCIGDADKIARPQLRAYNVLDELKPFFFDVCVLSGSPLCHAVV